MDCRQHSKLAGGEVSHGRFEALRRIGQDGRLLKASRSKLNPNTDRLGHRAEFSLQYSAAKNKLPQTLGFVHEVLVTRDGIQKPTTNQDNELSPGSGDGDIQSLGAENELRLG